MVQLLPKLLKVVAAAAAADADVDLRLLLFDDLDTNGYPGQLGEIETEEVPAPTAGGEGTLTESNANGCNIKCTAGKWVK